MDVQGRLCTVLFHGQIGNGQVRVLTHAPDQSQFGKGRPKHVEHTCSC